MRSIRTPKASALLAASTAFASSWTTDIVVATGLSLFMVFGFAGFFYLCFLSILKGTMSKPSNIEYLMFGFLVWCAATTLWTKNITLTITQTYYYFASFCFFLLAFKVSKSPKSWALIGWSFIGGCFVASILVLRNAAAFVQTGPFAERATVGELNANYVAYSIATSIPVLLAMMSIQRRPTLLKLGAMGYVALASAAILATGSRGALVAVGAALGVFFAMHLRRHFFLAVIGATISGFLLFTLFDYLPEQLQTRLNLFALIVSGQSQSIDLSGRQDVWPIAIDYFYNNVFTGIGAGAFRGSNPYGIGAHNVPLTILSETGLIGALLYFSALILIFLRIFRTSANKSIRIAGFSLFACWIPIAFTGIWEGAAVAWMTFGWLLGAAQHPYIPQAAKVKRRRKGREQPYTHPLPQVHSQAASAVRSS